MPRNRVFYNWKRNIAKTAGQAASHVDSLCFEKRWVCPARRLTLAISWRLIHQHISCFVWWSCMVDKYRLCFIPNFCKHFLLNNNSNLYEKVVFPSPDNRSPYIVPSEAKLEQVILFTDNLVLNTESRSM